jgi:hypothetical protein
MASKRDPRVIKASFDVWLNRDMLFNNPPGMNIKIYRKYTKAKKIRYTRKIQFYLDKMEDAYFKHEHLRKVAVAIKLDDIVRYVWREDVLSEKEYDEINEKQRKSLGILCKNTRRDVGKS